MPSSVTAASFSQSRCNCVSPRRCLSPASVTCVLLRSNSSSRVKSAKMLQSRVTHRGVAKPEPLQLRQASKMHKPRVGDSRANQLQCLKLCQSSKMFQSSIRDRGFVKQEPLQLGQSPEVR